MHIEEAFVKLNIYIYILTKDDELLEKYNGIWEKVSKKNLIVNSIQRKISKS